MCVVVLCTPMECPTTHLSKCIDLKHRSRRRHWSLQRLMLFYSTHYLPPCEYLTEGEVGDFLLHRDEDESGHEDEDE